MKKKKETGRAALIPQESVGSKILLIRGNKVMIDYDLAKLYGVSTKALNQAVKRNRKRFPEDFMIKLTKPEKEKVVTNCDHLQALKYSPQLPYAFTEQGVAMLSSVLNSEKAIQVNILIMRAFTQLREMIATHKGLQRKIAELEEKYDYQFKVVFDAIKEILEPSVKSKKVIGFHGD